MKNTPDLVRLLGDVASISNESDTMDEALRRSLRHLCDAGDWDAGHAFLRADDTDHLSSSGIWEGKKGSPDLSDLRRASEALRIGPGRGWVGEIYETARPLWIEDVATATDFGRSDVARRTGFGSVLGFPMVVDSRVVGVVELFSRPPRTADPPVTELAAHLGRVLGNVFQREQSRKELDGALRRFEALFSLLPLPAVVASLPDGRYVEVNRRFEETFGYRRDEVLGRTEDDVGLWQDHRTRDQLLERVPSAPDFVAYDVTLVGRGGRSIAGIATVTRIPWDGRPHLLGMMLDVSELVEAKELLERRRKEVGVLVERLLTLQEEERSRLSRELHDRIGQTLTAIKLKVSELEQAEPDARARLAGEALGLLDDTLEGARTLSFDLRPAMLDELGLSNAVRTYSLRQATAADLNVNLQVSEHLGDIHPDTQTTCYRILQEAVTNAIRHADADTLTVRLHLEVDELVLGVEDDGRGFRTERGGVHLGLLIMRERAELVGGAVGVSSSPGTGTVVTARFPVGPDGGS